jgi:copper chaperone NosL
MDNSKKLSILTRLLLIISGVSLIAVLFLPIWRIELSAPQYPEGLCLKIHANDIKGDVNIVNGLNHYIGMKTLHKDDFPEFAILPYCIIFFVGLFILAGILNRKRWLYLSFSLFVMFGIIAMIDFWKWEYNYGHNLNPDAPIIVPGMAYQPPLIGFKQLLNFGAYSVPDYGGWIFVGAGGLLVLCLLIEWRKVANFKRGMLTAGMAGIGALSSCNSGPAPIALGKDNCAYCKMTIADARFGAELVTAKGKVFKFDDIQCMTSFAKQLETIERDQAIIYFADFCNNHGLIEANKSVLLKNSEIRCPMQGRVIAFNSQDSLQKVLTVYKGEVANWPLQ